MKYVEFYYDIVSPYSYLAFFRLKEIAAQQNALIDYKPVLLGGILKTTGNISPIQIPAKGRYAMRDMHDWAQYYDIPFTLNPNFPVNTLAIMRFLTAVQLKQPEQLEQLTEVLFNAMFKDALELDNLQVLGQLLQQRGWNQAEVMDWIQQDEIKQQLILNT